MPAGDLTRLVAAAGALAAGVAAVVIVVLLLSHTPGPVSMAAAPAAPAAPATPVAQAPVATPQRWPAAAGSALMARAGRVWRSLRTLSFREQLASDATHSVTSVWRAAAPDRIAYTVTKGYSSVVIGGRRWDRAPGGPWVESSQTAPIHQPVPFWVSVANAHVLDSVRLRGRDVWRVSFFDPGTPGWF